MTSTNEPALRVALLGQFAVWRHGEQVPEGDWPRKKTKDLLKVLLTAPGEPFLVDQLVEALFSESDPTRAVANVHSRISELRRVLEAELKNGRESAYIVRQGEAYRFDLRADCVVDTVAFEQKLAKARGEADAGEWMEAVEGFVSAIELYKGDFLPEDRYEERMHPTRERLREAHLEALTLLSEGYGKLDRTRQAIDCCNRILAIEPHRESAIRLLMRRLSENGERARALAAYEAGARALRDHLNVEPSAETEAVRKRIMSKPIEPVPLNPRRIAVIPLVSIGKDPESEVFADGMTEELIYTLSKSAGLEVISQTSVLKYKGVRTSVAEVGQELRVGSVVEGSVRKVGDAVRVVVQLIDVRSDAHLWAEQYDRGIEDILSVQGDIARNAMDALGVQLLKREEREVRKLPTDDYRAHIACMRGRYFLRKQGHDDTQRAIECFKVALELDPSYARAVAGLADACLNLRRYEPGYEDMAKARQYASRALELDPTLGEAYASLAYIVWMWDHDHERAEQLLLRSIELAPNFALARERYAFFLYGRRRMSESTAQYEAAISLDPCSAQTLYYYAFALGDSGRREEGIEQCRRAIGLNPDYDAAVYGLVTGLESAWRWDEAEAAARQAVEARPDRPLRLATLGSHLIVRGNADEGLAALERAGEHSDERQLFSTLVAANAYTLAGEFDRAIPLFEEVIDRQPSRADVHVDLGIIHTLQRRLDEALAEFDRYEALCGGEQVDDYYFTMAVAWRGRVHVLRGESEKAGEQLERLMEAEGMMNRASMIASLLTAMERVEEAFDWLEKAVEAREGNCAALGALPDFECIRSDPRFLAILKKVGLRR